MNNLQRLPLLAYVALWVVVRQSYPKSITSVTYVDMIRYERDDLKTIIRFFDTYDPKGKLAEYVAGRLVKFCNDRITKLNELERFMTLSIQVTFIPFSKE